MAEAFFQATAWTMDTPKPMELSSGPDRPWCILKHFSCPEVLFSGKKSRTGYHSFFMRLIFRADRII